MEAEGVLKHSLTFFICQQGEHFIFIFSVGKIQLHWSDSWLTAVIVIRLGRKQRDPDQAVSPNILESLSREKHCLILLK